MNPRGCKKVLGGRFQLHDIPIIPQKTSPWINTDETLDAQKKISDLLAGESVFIYFISAPFTKVERTILWYFHGMDHGQSTPLIGWLPYIPIF